MANTEQITGGKGRTSYSSVKLHARRDKRRREAEARQREYDGLTVKDRLARAKAGGGKREIARLEAKIKAAKKA